MSETFGQLLRRYREARGWSIYHLAKRANCDRAYILRLETGERHPARGTVSRLAMELELTAAEMGEFDIAAGFWPGEKCARLVLDALVAARANGIESKWRI